MAIADLPDELHEYVPTLEDEGTNADAPVDPMLAPDDDPNVLELDEPEVAGVSVEDAVIEEPEGFDAGFGLIESRESSLPVYAQGDAAALTLEIDPAVESTLDDEGDIYSMSDGSPSDIAWAAAVDLAPALGTVDEPEFDDEPISLPEGEEAAEQIVPIQYEIQGRSLTAEWHTLATVAADSTSAEVAGLPTEDNWSFRVRAIYPNGLTGDWSAETDVNLPTDLLAPPVPSAPTLTAGRGIITVHWDGKGANGEGQPADYQHTAVWVSTSGEVGTWTIAGLLFADGGHLPYTFASYNVPHYFSLSSRDLVGNESARSASASISLKPLVEEVDIQEELQRIDEKYDGVVTESQQLNSRLEDAEAEQILHGEIINNLETVELPNLKQRLTDTEAEVGLAQAELSTRLGAAETELTAHTQRLIDNEAELDLAQADLDEALDGVIALRDTELPALDARLRATQAELDESQLDLSNRLNGAESELTAHGKRLATSEANLAAAQGEVGAALNDITDLRDVRLPALGFRLGSAETELASTQADLDTLSETVIPALESGISGTQTRLGAAESEITGAKARITEAESDLTDAFKRIDLVADDTAAAQKSANEAKQDAINKSEAARVAAVAEAEATATAKAAAAVSDATTAAAADAKKKADAAQAAAIAAAKTATDLAASGAKKEAIDAAKADAKTKADAAQAAAIAAAASDATAKANKAKADATTAAANDATAKANAAKADAIAAASSDATAKANTAKTEAVAAATTMTNGIGKNLSSTAAPTTSNAAPNGSVWRRMDSSGRVIGSWEQTGAGVASTWTPRLIRSEVIDNVDIGKLSASSATINTAVVNKMAAQVATVIELNADRITAGAIKASQIDASSLAVAIASVIQLNASKITAGTISVDRLDVSSLAVSIANVISLNASKITAGTISAARLNVNDLAVRIASVIELNASKINAGTINTSRLDTAAIAAATASIQKADIKNLTVSSGTFSAAVIEKLWADVITARKIVANQVLVGRGGNELVDPNFVDFDMRVARQAGMGTGWYWSEYAGEWTAARTSDNTNSDWSINNGSAGDLGDYIPVSPETEYALTIDASGTFDTFYWVVYHTGSIGSPGDFISGKNDGAGRQVSTFTQKFGDWRGSAGQRVVAVRPVIRSRAADNFIRIYSVRFAPMTDGSLVVNGSITGEHVEAKSVAAEVATVIELNAGRILSGTVNTNRLDTVAIAAKTALIQKADIKNLTVSSGTFSSAVIEKLWADVITARKIMADQVYIGQGENMIAWPASASGDLAVAPGIQYYLGPNSGQTPNWQASAGLSDGRHLYFACDHVATGTDTNVITIGAAARGGTNGSNGWSVEAGEWLNASLYIKAGGSYSNGMPNVRIGLYFYSSTGALVSSRISSPASLTWSWQKIQIDGAAPATAANVLVYVRQDQPGGVRIDMPTLYRKKGGDLIVTGSITGDHIESKSVSAEVAKFINLDVSRLVATSANISEAVINKLWADVIHARKITADMMVIGAGNNLIPNASLANSSDGWSGWGRNVSNGPNGVPSIWLQGRTNGVSSPFPVQAGKKYRFDVAALAQVTGSRIYIQLNTNGAANPYLVSNEELATWWRYYGFEVTIPDGATEAYLNVYANHPNGSSTTGYQWFTQWNFRPMSDGELIVDGSITAAKIKAKSITAEELATNSVTSDKIRGGAIDGQVITGATMRTNSAGTGVIIDKTGVTAKTSAGTQFFLSAVTGMMSARGDITTGADNTYRAKLSNRDGMAALDLYSAGGNAAHHGALISWSDSVALRRYTSETFYNQQLAFTPTMTSLRHTGNGPILKMDTTVTNLNSYHDSKLHLESKRAILEAESGSKLDISADRVDLMHANSSRMILQSISYNGAMHFLSPMIEATTTTGGANINVNAGYIRKVTSASKYKLFPKAFGESLDDKLLSIDAKHWLDKHEAEETSQLMCPETLDMATDPALDPDQAATNPMRRVPGVIAEEVRDAGLDEFVVYDANGEVEGVMYDRLGVALIPVVKRQRDRLTAQADRIDELEAKLAALTDKVDALLAA